MDKIYPIKEYGQSTYLTCLSACFLMLRKYFEKDLAYSKELELEEFVNALKLERDFYQIGFIKSSEDNGYTTTFITEIPEINTLLISLKKKHTLNTNVILETITLKSIKKTLVDAYSPIIVFIDQYPLSNYVRTQHYIVVYGFDRDNIYIVEPWYGKKMKVSNIVFQKTLDSLRDNLYCGVQIIYINNAIPGKPLTDSE